MLHSVFLSDVLNHGGHCSTIRENLWHQGFRLFFADLAWYRSSEFDQREALGFNFRENFQLVHALFSVVSLFSLHTSLPRTARRGAEEEGIQLSMCDVLHRGSDHVLIAAGARSSGLHCIWCHHRCPWKARAMARFLYRYRFCFSSIPCLEAQCS